MTEKRFCHFCGLREDVLDELVVKDDIGICDRCVRMSAIIIDEIRAERAKKAEQPPTTVEWSWCL